MLKEGVKTLKLLKTIGLISLIEYITPLQFSHSASSRRCNHGQDHSVRRPSRTCLVLWRLVPPRLFLWMYRRSDGNRCHAGWRRRQPTIASPDCCRGQPVELLVKYIKRVKDFVGIGHAAGWEKKGRAQTGLLAWSQACSTRWLPTLNA